MILTLSWDLGAGYRQLGQGKLFILDLNFNSESTQDNAFKKWLFYCMIFKNYDKKRREEKMIANRNQVQ
jgi:hypothetical protein